MDYGSGGQHINNDRQSFGIIPQGSPLRNRNQGNSLNRSGLIGNSSQLRSSFNEEEEQYNRRRLEAISGSNRPPSAVTNHTLQASFLQPQNRPNSAAVVSTVGRVSLKSQIPNHGQTSFALGQQSQDLLRQHQSIPLHIKEHIAHLQNDNASLMRRLNLVHQELERINREKGDLQSQLSTLVAHSSQAYDNLTQEENVDRSNKYMKDDLAYERERNTQLKQGIQDLNQQVLNLSAEIRKMEDDQSFMIRSNQESTYHIQRSMGEVSDLEKEQYFNQERIRDTHLSIEQSQISNEHLFQQNQTIRAAIEMVIGERNHVLERVNILSAQYDETVRQISAERKMMEMQNASHAKFITAKVIFNQLQNAYELKMQMGFQEIQNYTKFDTRCNLKLRALQKLLLTVGETKQRIALNHWFSCSLKPMEVKTQAALISADCGNVVAKAKFYHLWRNTYLKRVKNYKSKTHGIQILWHKLVNDAKIESKRAFRIWKETSSKAKLQRYVVKRLLWKKSFKMGSTAINAWKNYSSYFDSQVRLNLLAQGYSYQQQQAILFRNFHMQSQDYKRRRLSKLSHCLKGWRDYLNRQRYLMSQNLLTAYFDTENFTSIIKACFDALKQHKQDRKYEKSHDYLQKDEMTRINDLKIGNMYILNERYKVNARRAFETVKTCLSKRLWSYINHWRQLNVDYHESVRTTLADRVTKLYFSQIRISFSQWRKMHLDSKNSERKNLIRSIQGDNLDLQNRGIELTNSNNDKLDERSQQRQRHLLECVEGFERRFMSIALGRWRDRSNELNTKEHGAYIIMRRLRLRLARKTFDLYREGLEFKNKLEVQEARCAMFQKLRQQRTLNEVINQWMIYKQNHLTAKNYWYRIFTRLELSYKRLSIKRWREVTQFKVENSLNDHSESIVSTIEQLNHSIGELDQTQTNQTIYINGQKTLLNKQGQRILSNAFAHFYKVNLTRGFEKWHDFMHFEHMKNRLLEKAVQHSKKSQFYIFKMAFQNFIKNGDIKERQDQIKREVMRVNDTIFQTKMQLENFQKHQAELTELTDEEKEKQRIYNIKLQNVIKLIIKRVNENHYTSQRRFIFDQWSDHTRREVYFINCIKNVFSKSLWETGFQAIKQHSRGKQLASLKLEVLSKFFTMFTHRVYSRSFCKWRTGDFTKCKSIQALTLATTADLNEKHHELKQKIKKHNRKRAEIILDRQFQRNVLGAWHNIAQYLRMQKDVTNQIILENRDKDINNALMKWRARSKITKETRASYQRTVQKNNSLKLRMCFDALKHEHFYQRELCVRIANLANVLDNLKLQTGYHAIKSYAKAKGFAFKKRKENAAIWLGEALNSVFHKKMSQYLAHFKIRSLNKRKIDTFKRLTISLTLTNSIRQGFLQWKEAAAKQQLAKELNEEGPVREEDFNYKSQLKNINQMLKDEGYDDQDIGQALKLENSKQSKLMLKTVRRLQHFNKDLYYAPKYFDRWREFVQYKKAFRYWLSFVEKRSKLIKSDLHYVFDRWRRFHPSKKNELTLKSKKQLNKQAVINNRVLDRLAEDIESKEATIDHLQAQRETLLDNYVKAQKLALVLWVNHHKLGLHQALKKWSDYAKSQRNLETKVLLKNNLASLEILKQRIKQLEEENDLVASENEDLRQFSLDGYDIAKNVQVLAGEREILSVDLADKSKVITKLLDENEILSRKLGKAQEYAARLITNIRAAQKQQSNQEKQQQPPARPSSSVRPGSAVSQQRPGSGLGGSMNRTIRQ